MINRNTTDNKISEKGDKDGEIIHKTVITHAFNDYFVELREQLAKKFSKDSLLMYIYHPVNVFHSFQKIWENQVLGLLNGLEDKGVKNRD